VKTAAQAAAPSLPGMDNPFSNIESKVRNGTGNDPEALKNAAVSAMRAAVTGDATQQKDAQEKAAQALAKAQNIPVEQARTQVALYGALALVLGALAAFFAGRGAAVDPVLTRTAVAATTTQRRV
ncbi:PhnA-like protein, partial [Methylobacterium sp. WL116]